ncbi:MAG: nuoH [Rickettsiales bacterium]|jgi:NADH-quinone oxidoreductase subunit H|nr:nuoH [Rickettsiales bacterium]
MELEQLLQQYIIPLAWIVGKILLIVLPLLGAVAYLTYVERKVIARMQLRRGPNVVGPFGLLQPLADGLKLMFKEVVLPTKANKVLFVMAPMLTFTLAMIGWAVIPFDEGLVLADINVGILYLLAISSLGVYGVVIAGWSSNSKYAFLGGIRSASQMISYEVAIGFAIICMLLVAGSLNLTEIVLAQKAMPVWLHLLLFPMVIVFFVCILAETNRHPFDLPEAEAELVAGFNVEYSSMTFALFFLGEYANMILMSGICAILFMGGWLPPTFFGIFPVGTLPFLQIIPGILWFGAKIAFLLFCFLWVRATFPRYRYDQLMRLGWKVFLPLTLIWVVLVSGTLLYTGMLPNQG